MIDKIKQILKKYGAWIIVFISILIVLKIAREIFEDEIMYIDTWFYETFIQTIRNNTLTKIMKLITSFGNSRMIILLTFFSFFICSNKRKSICIGLNALITTIINLTLKNIVQRKRPSEIFLIIESGFSFPSGHAMISMAFYGFIIYLISQKVKDKTKRNIIIIPLVILILLIGFSRIYLGVHYFSDVVAGFLTSLAYLIIFIKVSKKYIQGGIKKNEKK